MSKAENQLKLQTAFSYHQAGNLTRAAELYQDVLKNDPRDIHALHYLGIVEASAGNLENAKSLIARSLSGQTPNIPKIMQRSCARRETMNPSSEPANKVCDWRPAVLRFSTSARFPCSS
jgi:cytochrome c-type biogenesis protein CcmH/NrfG